MVSWSDAIPYMLHDAHNYNVTVYVFFYNYHFPTMHIAVQHQSSFDAESQDVSKDCNMLTPHLPVSIKGNRLKL